MKKNRKSRLKSICQGQDDKPTPPTAQTVRRNRPDKIVRLVKAGHLTGHHLDVVVEIRAVHESVGRGMFPTAQYVSPAGRNRQRAGAVDFLDRMSAKERRAWQRHYLPWSHDLSVSILSGMPGTRWLQLIVDVVIDNCGLREIEDRYQLQHGTGVKYLQAGLERYPAFGRRVVLR